jgi:uncharacterized protein (TIGR02757 family)
MSRINSIKSNIKELLEQKVIEYNNPAFIHSDPIQIPHRYTLKEDIEISSFLTATIAWGNRKIIIQNADKMMELLGNSPYDYIINHKESDLDSLDGYVHRTFNSLDLKYFIKALKNIYTNHGGMEYVFQNNITANSTQRAIHEFKKLFFSLDHEARTQKHVGDPNKGSSCKRLNMMLRWLVRDDNAGVDFGIWKNIPSSILSCPLDVHSGNVARKLGLLKRKQNDAKALEELDKSLRRLDPNDPVKYDFALFGLGVFEGF